MVQLTKKSERMNLDGNRNHIYFYFIVVQVSVEVCCKASLDVDSVGVQ